MSHPYRSLLLALPLLGAFPLLSPSPACAPAPRQGQFVQIADESAIIIWDAESKTQHFIRRATFQTEADDFGFLVPTPSQPTLAESSDEAFDTLGKFTEPPVITKTRDASPGCGIGCGADMALKSEVMGGRAAPDAVRVLEQRRVAGHDSAVLEADDAKALNKWLKDHGYASRPELVVWLEPYVKQRWKITAFKIAKDAEKAPGISTSAIRMTFKTEQPFFPYREPADQRDEKATRRSPARLLRVFLLANKRMEGTLGQDGSWPGRTVHASEFTHEEKTLDTSKLLNELKLPDGTLGQSWWLTEFEDRASPRPGTDEVFFRPAKDQTKMRRPAIIQYVQRDAPGIAMLLAVVVGLLAPALVPSRRRGR